jgi:hypothetical protein
VQTQLCVTLALTFLHDLSHSSVSSSTEYHTAGSVPDLLIISRNLSTGGRSLPNWQSFPAHDPAWQCGSSLCCLYLHSLPCDRHHLDNVAVVCAACTCTAYLHSVGRDCNHRLFFTQKSTDNIFLTLTTNLLRFIFSKLCAVQKLVQSAKCRPA